MEPLKDPLHDRPIRSVSPPPRAPLSPELLFPGGETSPPDWRCLKKHLFGEGRLYIESINRIVKWCSELCAAEPNMVKLKDPITVVGDIHGQYYDLMKLLDVGGDPSTTQYLFLGDYVDRGSFSVEVLLLLYALKINYPKTITLLRGNHECRQMTAFFNFRDECEYKYNLTVYELFMESFDSLPLAAVVNGKFLCIHGGLSPDLNTLNDFNNINRFQEPPRQGLFCDILWSDPEEEKEGPVAFRSKEKSFVPNDVRGCSFFYTYEAATKFLGKNSLLSVIRAHEAQLEGYKMHKLNLRIQGDELLMVSWRRSPESLCRNDYIIDQISSSAQRVALSKEHGGLLVSETPSSELDLYSGTNEATGFPSVITIFSAPNYCDVYNNKGAVLKFENNTLNILQFNFTKHPYHLPNFMDVFAWSMPFVAEKITEMLFYILNPQNESGDYARAPDVADAELPQLPQADLQQLKLARLASLSEEQNKSVSLAARLHQHMMAEGAKAIEKSREAEASGKAISKEKADRMRKKIQTVSRMMLMFKTLREENETIINLKGVCPGHRLAPGLLLSGRDALKNELQKFAEARSMDLENERMPTQKEVDSQPHFHRGMSSS